MSISSKFDEKQILTKLAKDFHDLVINKEALHSSVIDFLNNVIDELTLGIIFDLHRKYKTKAYDLEMEDKEEDDDNQELNVFDCACTNCICPQCDRTVAATKFAPHLATCMGMGRIRTGTRRTASCSSKDRENPSYSEAVSDDEDDIFWNSGKRCKKKKRNGNKKQKSSNKKGGDSKTDTNNAEMDGEDDVLASMREFLQDRSMCSSPADSVSSNHSSGSSKKKDKAKSKKSKRDRASPSSSVSAD